MSPRDKDLLRQQVQLLEQKLNQFRQQSREQGEAYKRVKGQLAHTKEENAKLRANYERCCTEMKQEFEEIKSGMEQTWNE